MLVKGYWRSVDQNLTAASHAKIEALLSVRTRIKILKLPICLLKSLLKKLVPFESSMYSNAFQYQWFFD